MVQQTRTDQDTQLSSMFDDGGAATAAEFRSFMANLMDSVAFSALSGDLVDGQFVRVQISGSLMTFMPTPISEDSDGVQSNMPLFAPGRDGYNVGPVSVRSAGSTAELYDKSRNKSFRPGVHEVTEGAGIERRMFYGKPADTSTTTASTVTATETFPGTTLQAAIVNANTGTAAEYRALTRAAGAAEITGANLTIRRNSHADDHPVFDYKRDVSVDGFTLNGGAGVTTTTVDLMGDYLFLAGETLYITVEGDGSTPLQIMGQTVSSETVPHIDTYGRLETITHVEDALGNPAADGYLLSSTAAGARSWTSGAGVADLLEGLSGDDRLDYNALKNLPAINPPPLTAPSIDSFTLDGISQGEDAPYDLDGVVTFRFAISSASNIQGDLTILQGSAVLSSTIAKTATSAALTVNTVTLNAGESVTFTIRATSALSGNPTIERSFTVTAVEAQDYLYLATEDDSDPATTVIASATQVGYTPGDQVVTIPTFAGNKYLKILQRATDPEVTQILIGGINQFGAFTKTDDAITVGGVLFDAYVSTNLLVGSVVSGQQMTLVRS